MLQFSSVYGGAAKPRANKAPGIRNLGNSCFMNVVLQSLASIRSFHQYLEQLAKESPNDKEALELTKALKETLEQLRTERGIIENPQITRVTKLKRKFLTREQQDAHEFMQYVLSTINDEAKDIRERSTKLSLASIFSKTPTTEIKSYNNEGLQHVFSRLQFKKPNLDANEKLTLTEDSTKLQLEPLERQHNPFVGLLQSVLRCKACKNETPTFQSFVDLSLSIPESYLYSKEECPLEKCLKDFTAEETVSGVYCKNCTDRRAKEKKIGPGMSALSTSSPPFFKTATDALPPKEVKVYETAVKRLSIARSPNVLCLHIRRLICTSTGLAKLNSPLKFPAELDISPYCSTFQYNNTVDVDIESKPPAKSTNITIKTPNRSIPAANQQWNAINEVNNSEKTPLFGGHSPTEAIISGSHFFSKTPGEKDPAHSMTSFRATAAKKTTTTITTTTTTAPVKKAVPAATNGPAKAQTIRPTLGPSARPVAGGVTRSREGENTGGSKSNQQYQLVSVVVHHGSHAGGHYTVYRKTLPTDHQEGGWVHISDEISQNLNDEKAVLKEKQGYILFYEKKQTSNEMTK